VSVAHKYATVDVQHLAGDVSRAVGQQEQDRPDDVVTDAHSAH
jgi:hypothetical protein